MNFKMNILLIFSLLLIYQVNAGSKKPKPQENKKIDALCVRVSNSGLKERNFGITITKNLSEQTPANIKTRKFIFTAWGLREITRQG